MIPILYSSIHANFPSNKTGQLAYLGECVYCTVEEARNGIYECEFQYPIEGRHYADILEGRYIVCTHDEQEDDLQPFRIYKHSAPMNGIVTFYAHHLSYLLSMIILEPFTASSLTQTISFLSSKSINTNPFSFWTSKSGSQNFKVMVPTSVKSALGGTAGSILDVYGGGEYEFDVWQVKLHSQRGSDTGVTIRYGKNLTDIEHTHDAESTYDAVVPYYKSAEDAEPTLLTELIVSRTGVTNPRAIPLDLTSNFDEAPTEAQLRTAAQNYLANNEPWVASDNLKVDFVQLWQTKEYENVASLQRVKLCDRVSVYYPELGAIAENFKVVRVIYNVLEDRYDKMELGTIRTNFIERIDSETKEQVKEQIAGFEAVFRAEIEHATDMITQPGNSHIVFKGKDSNGDPIYGNGAVPDPEEMYALNTKSPTTATKVLRLNTNGIGFADGFNGPYRSAWTIDGHFIADYITAGMLNANIIRTGMLSDYAGATWSQTSDSSIVSGKTYYKRVIKSLTDKISFNVSQGYWTDGGSIASSSIGGLCTSSLLQLTAGTRCAVVINEDGWDYSVKQGNTASNLSYTVQHSKESEFNVTKPYVGIQFYKKDGSGNWVELTTSDFTLSDGTKAVDVYKPEYTYAVVNNPVVSELSTYYEVTRGNNNNYWNLETGEFRLAANTKIGNKTISQIESEINQMASPDLTQQNVFNALTDGGQVQGIFLQNGELYINGTYIATGTIADVNHTNYWNLSTGEFRLAANTMIGDKTISQIESEISEMANPDLTQQKVFNALTNNGQTQGIYLQNGRLYINASYIAAGILEDVGHNTSFDLSDGTLTINKGSINIGDRFVVSSDGYLTCYGASIRGTFEAGNESSKWICLNSDGQLEGGFGDQSYGFIDYSASIDMYTDGMFIGNTQGIKIKSGILDIHTNYIGVVQSSNPNVESTRGGNGKLNFIESIWVDNEGYIHWVPNYIRFVNGLMCTELSEAWDE